MKGNEKQEAKMERKGEREDEKGRREVRRWIRRKRAPEDNTEKRKGDEKIRRSK